jgi:hypothetical protein
MSDYWGKRSPAVTGGAFLWLWLAALAALFLRAQI